MLVLQRKTRSIKGELTGSFEFDLDQRKSSILSLLLPPRIVSSIELFIIRKIDLAVNEKFFPRRRKNGTVDVYDTKKKIKLFDLHLQIIINNSYT